MAPTEGRGLTESTTRRRVYISTDGTLLDVHFVLFNNDDVSAEQEFALASTFSFNTFIFTDQLSDGRPNNVER